MKKTTIPIVGILFCFFIKTSFGQEVTFVCKSILFLFITSFSFKSFGQIPEVDWVSNIGSDLKNERVFSVATDDDGNVYAGGYFQGTSDFDSSPSSTYYLTAQSNFQNGFIAKYTSNGDLIWAKSFECDYISHVRSIEIDQNNQILIVGEFVGNIDLDPNLGTQGYSSPLYRNLFLVKLDSSSNYIWSFTILDDSQIRPDKIVVDNSNNIVITGIFHSDVDFDPSVNTNLISPSIVNEQDQFIAKYSSSGSYMWAKRVGVSRGVERNTKVDFDDDNNLFTCTLFKGTTNLPLGPNYAAYASIGTSPISDILLSKFDSAGNFLWAKHILGTGAAGLKVDNSGNIICVGVFLGTQDFDPGINSFNLNHSGPGYSAFILKLDNDGGFIWAKSYGKSSVRSTNENSFSIDVDQENNIYTQGHFVGVPFDADPSSNVFNVPPFNSNFVNSDHDIFLQKLDSFGVFQWAGAIGTSGGMDTGDELVVDTCGSVYSVGSFIGVSDFDPSTDSLLLASYGVYDGYILKLTGCSLCIVDSSTDIISACDSVTWIDGVTYTSSNNNATYTLTNSNNCDSIVTLDLTITNSTFGTDIQTACDSFTWIDGNTYTSSNNSATYTLTNAANCDSVVTLNLTITDELLITDVQTACDSFLWIDGITYTASNNSASYILPSSTGCDTTFNLDLTIIDVDNSVLDNNPELSAATFGATYQWLDCSNDFAQIPGETNQSYIAEENGVYAVEITQNGCIDTSACINVNLVSDFIVVPNGFTPDGMGDPDNNFFYPITNPNGNIAIVGVTIFNRWGTKIYDNPAPPGWDGTYKGERQPIGTYVYFINYVENGQLKQISGDISILN